MNKKVDEDDFDITTTFQEDKSSGDEQVEETKTVSQRTTLPLDNDADDIIKSEEIPSEIASSACEPATEPI